MVSCSSIHTSPTTYFCFVMLSVVVEHVRDGCTLRVITLKPFQVLTVAMTGIKVCVLSLIRLRTSVLQ